MIYEEYKPHSLLSQYIECYWSAYAERPPFREQEVLIPDGTIELMFNFGDPYDQIRSGEKKTVEGSHIIGIRREALRISQTNKQNFFSIRFRPGGLFPFLNVPVHFYANGFYSLEEIIGPEYKILEQKLFESENNSERVQVTEKYLFGKLLPHKTDYGFVRACLGILKQTSPLQISGLAEKMNTNYKTIERKFKRVIGLPPSRLLKIQRFNKALHTIYSCKHDTLTEVGLHCGYYDQSHFIHEFKQLTNYSPGEFLKEQFTIVEVIQPALAKRLSKSYNL